VRDVKGKGENLRGSFPGWPSRRRLFLGAGVGFFPRPSPALFLAGCCIGFGLGGYQLHNGYRRAISLPPSDFNDSAVTAGTIFKARRQGIEEFVHDVLVLNNRKRLPPRVQRPLLAQSDHAVGPAPELFGLGIGRLYALVTQQRCH